MDLETSASQEKDASVEEQVDHLARFVFAVAPNLKGSVPMFMNQIQAVLMTSRTATPCLNMKSRFKLEDALKLLKTPSA